MEGIVYETSDRFGVFVGSRRLLQRADPEKRSLWGPEGGTKDIGQSPSGKGGWKDGLKCPGKAYLQMDEDARKIFERMEASGGSLPFTDKADPERIRQEFDMSKNAFKRAVGRLFKGREDQDYGKKH